MNKLSLKAACAFILAAGTVVAWQRDAHAIDALIACGIAYNVCVDGCESTYTGAQLNTCGGFCASDFLQCTGYGLHTPIPENYAD